MIKNNAKVDSLMRTLAEDLKLRTANSATIDTVREARNEGNPLLVLSDNATETAGNPVIWIEMKQVNAVSKDVFGNDLLAYAPHVCVLAYELDTNDKPQADAKDLALVMFELAKVGIKIQIKEIAEGDAVNAVNVAAAAVAKELDWLRWPTKGT